jgi:catechol 2,3-dioxygenase-like lactoylglutathione lyase family enzyme
MPEDSVLGKSKPIAFVCTTNPARARTFYEEVLGLRFVSDEAPFALVFDANGTMLRVAIVREHVAASHTVLGWEVTSIESVVKKLTGAGVEFQRYPGLNENHPLAIWTAPSGSRIAWFRDPDGNVLSLTEFR